MHNKNQILAVWGSPSSGKTVTSIKIAKELSKRKKNVVVVLCDINCPAISTVMPNCKVNDRSIGKLLSEPSISQEKILLCSIPVDKNPYISLLGYKNRDNVYTYPTYSKERVIDLLILLRHIADYVIIDCSSIITNDIMTTISLEMADVVLRLGCCELKGISYYLSHLPLIDENKFQPAKHIKVLSKVKPNEVQGEYYNFYNGVSYVLPYIEELYEQFLYGKLFDSLKGNYTKKYQTAMEKLVGEVFLK